MKKFLNEFKAFALRGNVMDMAIGVLIGGAFSGLVKSLTENFINPLLDVVTGKVVYGMTDVLGFVNTFASEVVNFIITAFVLFCLIKTMNKMSTLGEKKEEEAPAAPTTKECPYCKSTIAIEATRCPHCTSQL